MIAQVTPDQPEPAGLRKAANQDREDRRGKYMLKPIGALGVVALVFVSLLSGCTIGGLNVIQGSGNKTTETRQVSGFNAVELSGVGKLIVKQTGTESLTIEGDDN